MTDITAGSAECAREERDRQRLTPRQKVLVVLGAAVGLVCGVGTVFAGLVGICMKPMAASLNWSRADVTLLTIVIALGTALGAPCLGYFADRIGWSRVIAVSIMTLCAGLLAVSVAPPSYLYMIAVGLVTGMAGAAAGPPGYIGVISLTFDRRLGTAMGFAMLGGGVGALGVPIIANKLLEVMDWRQIFACFGAISLLLGVVGHQLIFRVLELERSGSNAGSSALPKAKEANPAGEGLSFKQAIGTYRFWVIGVVAAVVYTATMGALMHMAAYVTDRGISPATAAQTAGLVGLGMGLARFGVGLLLDRIFAPLLAFLVFLLSAAGFYLLTADIAQTAWMLPLAALLIGVSMGAEGDLIPFLAKRYFGTREFGTILGTLYGFIPIGGAIGQYLYGLVFDRLGSYTPIHQASAIACCLCAFSMLLLGSYRYTADRAAQ